ncbi:MAG: hypothetical protein WD492_15250 [Alkalispirochaeta sp.]
MTYRFRFFLVLTGAILVLLAVSVYNAYHQVVQVSPVDQLRTAFWFRAWMPLFFDHFSIAVAVSAVVTFSLLLSPYDLGNTGRLMPSVRPILLALVAMGLVNGLWFALVGPTVELRLDQIEYRSRVAGSARQRSEELLSHDRYDEALAALRLYRSAVGSSPELDEEIEELQVRAGQERRRTREAARRGGETTFARAFEVQGLSVPEMLRRARVALEAGSFYTAHYYASVAADQSEFRREDALELRAEALNAIEDGIRRREELEERSFFQDKLQAYQLMQRGDTDSRALVEAYYRFQELGERAPDDPDIRRYSQEVEQRVREVSFFVDEALDAQMFPGRQDVVFRNDRSGEFSELISAEQIIDSPQGTYLFGVEVLRRGDEIVHLSAPYGKRVGDMLVIRAIARRREAASDSVDEYVVGPRYLRGTPGRDDLGEMIPLQPDVDQLMLVAGGLETLNTLNLVGLVRAPAAYDAAGHIVAPVHAELVYRIMRIVGFFVTVFSSISIAWRYRSLYIGRPPILVVLLVPLLPWATWWVISLVRSVADSVLRALVLHGAAATTVVVAAGVMIVALLLAITSAARQQIEP